MCIDQDKTVEVATGGNGVPVRANIPPFSWAFDPNVKPYVLDVPGAKAKIEGAGWALGSDGVYAKDGKRLSSILYVRVGRPQRLAFAELARDQLKECGIEVEVVEGDLNTVLIPKVLDYPNDFDTYLGGWSTALDPDDYSIFHSSEIPSKDDAIGEQLPGLEERRGRLRSWKPVAPSSTRPSARRSTPSSRTSSTMSFRTTSRGRTSLTPACQSGSPRRTRRST